jgi:uncharacterized protein (TIGR00730 family)
MPLPLLSLDEHGAPAHILIMADIRSVCVYCGSAAGADPAFLEAARDFGSVLAREKIRLVYGGGGIGMMGALAHAVTEAGGEITGVIPEFLVAREHARAGAREIVITRDMHERKRIMFERADAFVALPGGIGTLEEVVEQLSWLQLERHRKPVLVLNIKGFWEPLIALIDHLRAQRFLHSDNLQLLVASRVEAVLPKLREAVRAIPEAELRGGAARVAAERM